MSENGDKEDIYDTLREATHMVIALCTSDIQHTTNTPRAPTPAPIPTMTDVQTPTLLNPSAFSMPFTRPITPPTIESILDQRHASGHKIYRDNRERRRIIHRLKQLDNKELRSRRLRLTYGDTTTTADGQNPATLTAEKPSRRRHATFRWSRHMLDEYLYTNIRPGESIT